MDKYIKQAQDFLKKTGTKLDIEYIGHGQHFEDDKETRDIYRFTIKREGRKYTAKFGQSIVHSGSSSGPKDKRYEGNRQAPSAYDILACLTKYDPGTFEDFCADYGYDPDSRKSERTYFAVQKEWDGVRRIWNEKEREELAEIN